MIDTDKYVIGMGFGDEGKGVVTDYLCSQNNTGFNPNKKVVVRFSGGQQAGHTVYSGKYRHVFSNFGSGTFRNVPTAWTNTCTIDPLGIVNEYRELLKFGLNPELFIHCDCPVTTSFEKLVNKKLNDATQHGSVGVGVGQTWEREANHYHLTFEDLFYPTVYTHKLELISKYYKNMNIFPESFDFAGEWAKNLVWIKELMDLVNHKQFKIDVFDGSDILIDRSGNVIYESSQGLMLDPKVGFFPHVTRSNLFDHVFQNTNDKEVYLVTRAYQTRHGNGPMTNELVPHQIKVNSEETNQSCYQGEFRRSMLDVSLLKYALEKSKLSKIQNHPFSELYLVITCLDHVYREWKFTFEENVIECESEQEFVTKIADLLNISRNFVLLNNSPYSESIRKFV